MSFVIICGILWHPVCTHFSEIQLVPDNSVHFPVNVATAQCVRMPHIICSGHAWCQHVLPLLIAMHYIFLFAWYYTYTIQCLQLAVDFYWCNTHHTQKSKHTSYFKVCHGSGRPSIFNLTYLWYPLTAVQ